jgi:50S ribosomal protein L16 3-hydroxylase
MSVADFTRTHLQRQVLAAPGKARAILPLLDWRTLGRVLSVADPQDVLVIAGGSIRERKAPRSLADLQHLFAEGIGCVVRRAARYDPALASLAEAFARELPGAIDLHVFVTPAGTHGFGWHYDTEDVFIVQTAGRKDYYFRENTVARGLPLSARPDLSLYPREVSPLATATLIPGDWLYLPATTWHVALSAEHSLSLSLGIRPACAPAAHCARAAQS